MSAVIKWMHSGMTDAPQLTNAFGSLVSLLDALLVNGFGLRSVDSITRTGSTVTMNISAGHPFVVGQVVLVDGAEQAAYNGEQVVTAITTNTVTYTVVGTPATPATTLSSLTCKVAPLGFEKVYSATNKAAYRSLNVLSNRPYLRLDDSQAAGYGSSFAKYAKVTICENMSGIDTIVGGRAPFNPTNPTQNETPSGSGSSLVNGRGKWIYAMAPGNNENVTPDTGNRGWVLVGDDRGFYLHNDFQAAAGNGRTHYAFGDFNSLSSTDAFDSFLCCHDKPDTVSSGGSYPGYTYGARTNNNEGKFLMQPWNQVGGALNFWMFTLDFGNTSTISGTTATVPYPNGPNYGLLLTPVYMKETGNNVRGVMPGVYFCPQDIINMNNLTVIENVTGFPGRKFLSVNVARDSQDGAIVFYDITGPWR